MNPVISRILARLHEKDKNFLAIFCGQSGSGKSESCISLACLLDPKFSVDNIVFGAEEFFHLLNTKKLAPGSVIVWEELGVSADSRQYFSLQNRAICYCFETFRWLNLAVLMNVPGLGMIDSRVRRLAHQYYETVSIDYERNLCRCMVMDMEYNPRLDKIYFKYPRVWVDDSLVTIECLDFDKPEDRLVVPYKERKRLFTEGLNLDLEVGIRESKVDRRNRPADVRGIVDSVLGDRGRFVSSVGGRCCVSLGLIQGEFGVGVVTARKAKALVEDRLRSGG